jgi:hypothetical protein
VSLRWRLMGGERYPLSGAVLPDRELKPLGERVDNRAWG